MKLFENRNNEGREAEAIRVKPKNQILHTPEKADAKGKEKLSRSWELTPEQQKKVEDGNKEITKKYHREKLDSPNNSSSGGETGIGQRERTRIMEYAQR